VQREYASDSLTLAACISTARHSPPTAGPPDYEEVDVGDDEPVRVLKNGLWLIDRGGDKFAMLLAPKESFRDTVAVQVFVGAPPTPSGEPFAREVFKRLEEAVARAASYRGKILSLENSEGSYSGETTGIKVHKLREVSREQVILPAATIDLLDRNVIRFTRQRPALRALGQSTKKGLLFFGPPGTGKTHTIHYLVRELAGHTTLLISAEQVGLLSEYMTLARLLQPSVVVLEDVDLIARDREQMGACEETMLNKLLNEMDGLKEEADVLFVLTTNRPEALEAALASRPGRVDQAIEFPPPDDAGRRKLIALYAPGGFPEALLDDLARRTDGVSAAFIKELLRRTLQFALERGGDASITPGDIDHALGEMMFEGNPLNFKLLGFRPVGRNGRP
jgi:AAA+ superfamily predicted ATPase